MRAIGVILTLLVVFAAPGATAREQPPAPVPAVAPLVIGEGFMLRSRVLDETRRVNVFRPTVYGEAIEGALPVLYMPDGGMAEDFLHIAGLLQVSVSNGTMRPHLLVGIENTERRRDLTGPTDSEEDRKIAPRVGGAKLFRDFLRDELMPAIASRYAVTGERALVGESLAGLFVVETFLREPTLFDTYIAIDPSLWWNGGRLVTHAASLAGEAASRGKKTLYLASSEQPEIAALTQRLADALRGSDGLQLHHAPMPREQHHSIYHPAALAAFRAVFAPAAD